MNLDALRQFFEDGIPFNRVIGLRVDALDRGSCITRVPFRPELIGDVTRPALHGGVLSTMADAAGGLAVMANLDVLAGVSTIDLRVDYLRPAGMADLLCLAETIRVGNRVGVTRMRIYQAEGDVTIAECRGVYNIRRLQETRRPNAEDHT